MQYLLDTGIWLRLSREPHSLSKACRTLLDAEPQVGLSAVSLREVAWKAAYGKLNLGQPTLAMPLWGMYFVGRFQGLRFACPWLLSVNPSD